MLTLMANSSINRPMAAHPFFVSVTEMRSDSKKQTFTVSCRMFTDDLQTAIFKLYAHKGELDKADGSANTVLEKYITERIAIKVAGKDVAFTFVGYETEEEATWCYLEATTFPGTGKVEITNKLLFDFIEGQTNLIHCYKDGVRNSYKLVQPEQYTSF